MHHLGNHAAEMLDLAILVGRPLHRRETRSDIADLLALIPDALEICNGLDDRHDHPQVTGRRSTRGENAARLLVDRDLHSVDLVIVHRHRFAERAVTLDQGGDGLLQLLLYKPAHREHFVAQALQILVEAARDVVRKISSFHRDLQGPQRTAIGAVYYASNRTDAKGLERVVTQLKPRSEQLLAAATRARAAKRECAGFLARGYLVRARRSARSGMEGKKRLRLPVPHVLAEYARIRPREVHHDEAVD